MKYGLLVTSPINNCKNIGDYVQSLAALTFMPKVDMYLEKEKVSLDESNEAVKVIMNGWYMWHPEYWPPKDNVIPLLTSVHISHLTAKRMLQGEKNAYMHKHSPIGCRDLQTMSILESAGVPCYFSGCLTLTLGEKFKSDTKKGTVFVDPYFEPLRDKLDDISIVYFSNIFKALFYFVKAPITILKLSKKDFFSARLWFMKYYNASMFYNAYKTKFTKDFILNSEYITHMVDVDDNESQENLLDRAKNLVDLYSKSQLVVTSRIHCALPCLGVETPVIFVQSNKMKSKSNLFNAPGRFDGLIDFFRVMNYSTDRIISDDEVLSNYNKIGLETRISNKRSWVTLKDSLVKQCKEFVK